MKLSLNQKKQKFAPLKNNFIICYIIFQKIKLIIKKMQLSYYNNILQSKKENIHMSNKKEDIKGKMKEMRSKLAKVYDNSLLQIIKKSEIQLDHMIVNQLLNYAHRDQQNAIMQLGNLIIDKPEVAGYIKNQLNPKNNDYWSWLCKLMVYARQNNPVISNYLLNKIKKNNSIFSLTNSLDAIAQLSKNQFFCGYLVNDRQCIKSIGNLMISIKQQIYLPAFKIFSNLVSFNQNYTSAIINVLHHKIENIMQIGLMKSEYEIKLLTSQALGNIALNYSIGQSIMDLISLRGKKQRISIIKELSFYFLNQVQIIDISKLCVFVNIYIIDLLKKYFSLQNNQIKQNACEIVINIFKRFRRINEESVFIYYYQQMQKYQIITNTRIQFYQQDQQIVSNLQFLINKTKE